MSLADDIDRLAAQRDAGRLTEAEFDAAKARLLAEPSVHQRVDDAATAPDVSAVNSLRRSLSDRWLGGVCGGLAKVTGLESWVIRLLFVAALLFAGFGFIPYVLLWIFVPPER